MEALSRFIDLCNKDCLKTIFNLAIPLPNLYHKRIFKHIITCCLQLQIMLTYLLGILHAIYRQCWKLFLKFLTGKCELLRIVCSHHTQIQKVTDIEMSLKLSRNDTLRNIHMSHERNFKEMVNYVVTAKKIKLDHYPEFEPKMEHYLKLIVGYRHLIDEVEEMRKTQYSSGNLEHEILLLQLWRELKSGEALNARKSKQWESIGFQGNDPATDFRGMGLLGLNCLLNLASNHKETAQYILSHSYHPSYGFSFAIVGINMTSLTFQLLVRGKLRRHFYSLLEKEPSIQDFYRVFVHLFYEFDRFWIGSKPESIMDFERIRRCFENMILTELQDGNMPLNFSFL